MYPTTAHVPTAVAGPKEMDYGYYNTTSMKCATQSKGNKDPAYREIPFI